jgi:Ca2+/Na+ antiporter
MWLIVELVSQFTIKKNIFNRSSLISLIVLFILMLNNNLSFVSSMKDNNKCCAVLLLIFFVVRFSTPVVTEQNCKF